ncbi:hypothetical protein [Streptomyces sp. NPDC048581]|uniref:hypothetical protein n=1 Tax=unclassified Streptomyces TaxID=2593676 RepID=UPI003712F7E5
MQVGQGLHQPSRRRREPTPYWPTLRRQGLLDPAADNDVPLLAANGAHDQFIPRGDTTRLAALPNTKVWIVPGATHCAAEHIRPLLAATWAWLLTRPAFRHRPAARTARSDR